MKIQKSIKAISKNKNINILNQQQQTSVKGGDDIIITIEDIVL